MSTISNGLKTEPSTAFQNFESSESDKQGLLKISNSRSKSISVILKSPTDHNQAFDLTSPSHKLLMNTLETRSSVQIVIPTNNKIGECLEKASPSKVETSIDSLTIMAHSNNKVIELDNTKNEGTYTNKDINGTDYNRLKNGAPIYLMCCSSARFGEKIAEKSKHPVYAPTESSSGLRTFLVPGKEGHLELLQYDEKGNRITKVFRLKDEKITESEPEAYKYAFPYLKAHAETGDVGAQRAVGEFYRIGKEVKRSLDEAAKWFSKGAKQGCNICKAELEDLTQIDDCAAAAIELSNMYRDGLGVPKSNQDATCWLRIASQKTRKKDSCVIS